MKTGWVGKSDVEKKGKGFVVYPAKLTTSDWWDIDWPPVKVYVIKAKDAEFIRETIDHLLERWPLHPSLRKCMEILGGR